MGHLNPDLIVPEIVDYLWDWFFDIREGVPTDGNNPQPISSLELLAWSKLTGNILTREDFYLLRAMDSAYRRQFAIEAADMAARIAADQGSG